MKKILIILQNYSSKISPNALLVERMVKFWLTQGLRINIVSLENENLESNGNFKVVYTSGSSSELQIFINKLRLLLFHSNRNSKKVFDEVKMLLRDGFYDTVIGVTNPMESADVLVKVKQEFPQIKCIFYEVDPVSNRYKTPKNMLEKCWRVVATNWELYIYKRVDLIVHMETHRQHFSKNRYNQFSNKSRYLDIPCLYISNYYQSSIHSFSIPIKLMYSGAFYKGLREPYDLFRLLKALSINLDLEITVFARKGGSLFRESDYFGLPNIKFENPIPQEILDMQISQYDILLSVGNMHSDFLPSKIFSYMGTGKPIIHIYSDKEDVALTYLSRYKRALLIFSEDKIDLQVEKVLLFINKIQNHEILDFDTILKEFCTNTPEYSAKKIMTFW